MHRIVAAGGGEVSENIAIDRHALNLCEVTVPKVLVLATAEAAPEEAENAAQFYANLGADSDILTLDTNLPRSRVHAAVSAANLIFSVIHDGEDVTSVWKSHQVHRSLAVTAKRPTPQVLSGSGEAGGMFFEFYTRITTEGTVEIAQGLDLYHNTLAIPHFSSQFPLFKRFFEEQLPMPNRRGESNTNAYALDDGAAVVLQPGTNELPYAFTNNGHQVQHISPRRGMPHVATPIRHYTA